MYARFLKRPLDFFCALAAILALSPLLLALTLVGAVKMHGNPFFTQPRPGKGERIFRLVKFRTMTNERDAQGNLLPDDVRLNAYGKFLRSTSLDELRNTRPLGAESACVHMVSPRSRQHDSLRRVAYGSRLFNILKGDMAVIGPRPDCMGGPALPRRHALFYGPASRLRHPAALVKPSRFPLGIIPALEPESSLAAPVSSPRGHDRCRETLMEAA